MRKLLFLMCLMALTMQAQEEIQYVDLGLPSGTLWKDANEQSGLYSLYKYEQAVSEFGNRLPTKAQFSELLEECRWTWYGGGYRVTGSNGVSIILPAAGFRNVNGYICMVGSEGYYWSSTSGGSETAWFLSCDSRRPFIRCDLRRCERSVRLVRNP